MSIKQKDITATRTTATARRGASIRPSTFKLTRDWIGELARSAAHPAFGEKMPREAQIGARQFPSHLLRWTEVVGDELQPRVPRHEVNAWMIGVGSRLILSLPAVDVVRDWRPVIQKYGTADDARWVKSFPFQPSGPEGYERQHTFHVLPEERTVVAAVCEVLRMQQGTVAALAITLVLVEFADILPTDVRAGLRAEIEKFKGELADRARKSTRLGMELCKARGIRPVTR